MADRKFDWECPPARQPGKFLADRRVLWLAGQVFHLQRIGFRIEQHRPILPLRAKFRIAPFFRPHRRAVQARAVLAPHAVGWPVPRRLRII